MIFHILLHKEDGAAIMISFISPQENHTTGALPEKFIPTGTPHLRHTGLSA
jgi:hypothetical protein